MSNYEEFLKQKAFIVPDRGFEAGAINPALFEFQADVVRYQLRKGRSMAGIDTGLGKTIIQVECAMQCHIKTGKPSLIIAPLSVARQTIKIAREVLGYDIDTSFVGEKTDAPIAITNYEMMHRQNPKRYGFVAFDESSIFKGKHGKYYQMARDMFTNTVDYIGLYSATQSPNNIVEYGQAATVLGIIKNPQEMESEFFINRGKRSGGRSVLRNLGKDTFRRWLSTWAIVMRKPSDLGYDDGNFILPPLYIEPQFVNAGYVPDGMLFFTKAGGLAGSETSRSAIYNGTMEERIEYVLNFLKEHHTNDQGIVWCLRNEESERISKALGGQAIEVTGTQNNADKQRFIEAFQDGAYRILVTKPKIAGMGMNFQNANFDVWAGINDSWETWKQCNARIHRFKQDRECFVYPIVANAQKDIWNNLMDKDKENNILLDELIEGTKEYSQNELRSGGQMITFNYETSTVKGDGWQAMLGDSAERLREISDNSVGLIVTSIPFAELFTYTATERDLGNSKDWDEFFKHLSFIIKEMYRVLMPGRNAIIHVMDIPARKKIDGHIGMRDFSGATIEAFEKDGFYWYGGRVFIEKNQQAKAITTHVFGLSFSALTKDAARTRMVIPDQMLIFKKGHHKENKAPILSHVNGELTRDDFIVWAGARWVDESQFFTNATPEQIQRFVELCRSNDDDAMTLLLDFIKDEMLTKPIDEFFYDAVAWEGIQETDVLGSRRLHPGTAGKERARDKDDEKHICPLQLEAIRRAVLLWSNRGETVLDPFGGIGSTGYQALLLGRKAIMCELKPSFFRQMVNNLDFAERQMQQLTLFDFAEEETNE